MHEPGPGFSGILPQNVRIATDQVLPDASVAEFVGHEPGEDGIIRRWIGSKHIDEE